MPAEGERNPGVQKITTIEIKMGLHPNGNPHNNHLSEDDITALAFARVSQIEEEEWMAHLEICPRCNALWKEHWEIFEMFLEASTPPPTEETKRLNAKLMEDLRVWFKNEGLFEKTHRRKRMPLFPYKADERFVSAVPQEYVETLENWINYGIGKNAEFELRSFWYELLNGDYTSAAIHGSPEDRAAMGWIVYELVVNAPGTCFGSAENMRSWRGLVEEGPTLLNQ